MCARVLVCVSPVVADKRSGEGRLAKRGRPDCENCVVVQDPALDAAEERLHHRGSVCRRCQAGSSQSSAPPPRLSGLGGLAITGRGALGTCSFGCLGSSVTGQKIRGEFHHYATQADCRELHHCRACVPPPPHPQAKAENCQSGRR